MPCSQITNNSNFEVDKYQPMFDSFFPYSQKVLGFDKQFSLNFASDQENSANPLGKTAYYDPSNSAITIYIDGRHIKDIMRSISHELVHHAQNCRGEFDKGISTDAGYAQEDGHLRGMEREAYEKGNLCFRDWEDQYKQLKENKMIKLVKKEIKKLLKLNEIGPVSMLPRAKAKGSQPKLQRRWTPDSGGHSPTYQERLEFVLNSPEDAADFLVSQAKSWDINNEEHKLIYKGLENVGKKKSWIKRFVKRYREEDLKRYTVVRGPDWQYPRLDVGNCFSTKCHRWRKRINAKLEEFEKKVGGSKFPPTKKGKTKKGKTKKGKTKKGGSAITVSRWTKCPDDMLKFGCMGDNVKVLQKKLIKLLGPNAIGPRKDDSKYGRRTKGGVRALQKKYQKDLPKSCKGGRRCDGIAGSETQGLLTRLIAAMTRTHAPKPLPMPAYYKSKRTTASPGQHPPAAGPQQKMQEQKVDFSQKHIEPIRNRFTKLFETLVGDLKK